MLDTWEWVERDGFIGWEITRRMSDGSTAAFGVNEYLADDGHTIQWSVEIEVYRKRKRRNVSSGEITGRCGLEAAGFFLESLTYFEKGLARPGDRIHAAGYDGRRHRAYQKVLEKRGYTPTRFEGYPYLVKIVPEEEA